MRPIHEIDIYLGLLILMIVGTLVALVLLVRWVSRKSRRFIIIFYSIVAILMALNMTGFCFRQCSYPSDEDLILAALRFSVGSMTIDRDEESIRRYYQEHPNCCYVDRWSDMAGGWFDKFFGFYWNEVEVNYKLNDEMEKIYEREFYRSYIHVGPCGDIGRVYGESDY